MKFILPLITYSFVLFSCQSFNGGKNQEQDSLTAIGGQKDKNGCLVAAGYTWSTLRKECVRPFEESIALYIMNTGQSYHTAAFVFIDSIQQKAEVFVPDEQNSIILDKSNGIYTNGKFNLQQEDHCWTLSLNQTKLYQERK